MQIFIDAGSSVGHNGNFVAANRCCRGVGLQRTRRSGLLPPRITRSYSSGALFYREGMDQVCVSPPLKVSYSSIQFSVLSACWACFVGVSGAAPKLTLKRLHQTETERYLDRSTSGGRA